MRNRALRNCILAGSVSTLILAAVGLYLCGPAAGVLILLSGAVLTAVLAF